ncbi:hypothetical protein [Flavobacterium sp. J27]|uniref:hypothetical protein n=1 Tax=Flavobacterium sp. J27 TaxID=2060419 RepID=UPI00102FC814|nr:hypothetical protein [Flavobacterium sp. J27]
MELAKGIIIPIIADFVLSPDVLYSDALTGIYFQTEDAQYGRITFEKLDALQICRGEILPYADNWETGQEYPWVYQIENSKWLKERFNYEQKNYGNSYEFNGNVNEMLTDFSHYIFKFHDQYVSALAKGFWYEKDKTSLFKREFQIGHPFLNLPKEPIERFVSHNLTCQVRVNPKPQEQLISDAKYCSQKLIEFALELDGRASVNHTLILFYRNGKLISSLKGYFGEEIATFDGIATLEEAKPYLEKYIGEVYNRRKVKVK